ncbi:MAG: hypothetical protein LBF09_06665 [Odoribacteraceae bacterium]|jgi:hypothetical protein|nr:hypothetical protein [Odoribacteraceae bacterium]
MEEKDIWKNVNELFVRAADNINILEEEIDINVQRQYMAFAKKLAANEEECKKLLREAKENIRSLFSDVMSDKEKKKLLVLLAMIDDVAIYRAIEIFAKQKGRLKKWATVALQQSRMLIQSTLMGEASLFVSTGLGGHGANLRYCCVLVVNNEVALQPYQRDIIQKESELAITRQGGCIERCEFHDRYVMLTLLLPILINLKAIFKDIIEECNTYGNFLNERMILTNVKKISTRDIETFIENEQSRKLNESKNE